MAIIMSILYNFNLTFSKMGRPPSYYLTGRSSSAYFESGFLIHNKGASSHPAYKDNKNISS